MWRIQPISSKSFFELSRVKGVYVQLRPGRHGSSRFEGAPMTGRPHSGLFRLVLNSDYFFQWYIKIIRLASFIEFRRCYCQCASWTPASSIQQQHGSFSAKGIRSVEIVGTTRSCGSAKHFDQEYQIGEFSDSSKWNRMFSMLISQVFAGIWVIPRVGESTKLKLWWPWICHRSLVEIMTFRWFGTDVADF